MKGSSSIVRREKIDQVTKDACTSFAVGYPVEAAINCRRPSFLYHHAGSSRGVRILGITTKRGRRQDRSRKNYFEIILVVDGVACLREDGEPFVLRPK